MRVSSERQARSITQCDCAPDLGLSPEHLGQARNGEARDRSISLPALPRHHRHASCRGDGLASRRFKRGAAISGHDDRRCTRAQVSVPGTEPTIVGRVQGLNVLSTHARNHSHLTRPVQSMPRAGSTSQHQRLALNGFGGPGGDAPNRFGVYPAGRGVKLVSASFRTRRQSRIGGLPRPRP